MKRKTDGLKSCRSDGEARRISNKFNNGNEILRPPHRWWKKAQDDAKRGKFSFPFTVSCSLHPAFTLAEVLITLGIIGIVAEMTIPTLMNNINEQSYKVGYKKAYSVASQAWLSAVTDNKTVTLPGLEVSDNTPQRMANFSAFQSYFKVIKTCGDASSSTLADITPCWANGEKWWTSFPYANGVAFIDNSGMAWVLTVSIATTNTNEVFVDVNGSKKPNKFGQDRFDLIPVTKDGNWAGDLIRIIPHQDCLSASDCSGQLYANVCPSVASHPCYYTSWLYN